MKLNVSQQRSLYLWCLNEDLSVSYGKLSLCNLENFKYSDVKYNRKYQVHSEDPKYPFSMIYEDKNAAVNKFMELKNKVKRIK